MALILHSRGEKFTALLVLSVCAAVSHSNAQELEDPEHSTIEPSIYAALIHDDNIFRSADAERSSLITVLSPSLLAIFKPPRHRFQLRYTGEFASYARSSADSYDDHELQGAALFELGRRGLLDLVGVLEDGHETRGAGLSEGLEPGSGSFLSEPDEYRQASVGSKLTYGATGTKGRLVFEAGRRDLEYSNNRDRTRFFDYDQIYGGATFYLRVMPSTSLLLSVRTNEFDYRVDRSSQPSLNSSEHRFLVGATWDITGKSTGTVRFGYVEKKYDESARPKFAGTSWDADIRWSLRSYSHLDFATSRYPSEVRSLTGDVIDNTVYSVAWNHDWTSRIRTRLATLQSREDFRGSTEARVETLTRHGLTIAYEMRRWLTWEFEVSATSRDSNIDRFSFDLNVVRLGANLTF